MASLVWEIRYAPPAQRRALHPGHESPLNGSRDRVTRRGQLAPTLLSPEVRLRHPMASSVQELELCLFIKALATCLPAPSHLRWGDMKAHILPGLGTLLRSSSVAHQHTLRPLGQAGARVSLLLSPPGSSPSPVEAHDFSLGASYLEPLPAWVSGSHTQQWIGINRVFLISQEVWGGSGNRSVGVITCAVGACMCVCVVSLPVTDTAKSENLGLSLRIRISICVSYTYMPSFPSWVLSSCGQKLCFTCVHQLPSTWQRARV